MKPGRKSKYESHVKPRLDEIRQWCRDGATDDDIMSRLKLSHQSFYKYKREIVEFAEVLKDSKEIADRQVENALFRRAVGFPSVEVHKNASGNVIKTIVKQIAGDTTAQIFWLKNRRPDIWRDKQEIDQTVTDMTETEKFRALFDSMTPEEKRTWLEQHSNEIK